MLERTAVLRTLGEVERASELQLFAGSGGVAVVATTSAGGTGKQVLYRFHGNGTEPLSAIDPVSIGERASVCATLDGVAYTAPMPGPAAQEEDLLHPRPWRALVAPFLPDARPLQVPSALLAGGADSAGMFCGPHRVFLIAENRASVGGASEHAAAPVQLPRYDPPPCPCHFQLSAEDDTLVEARSCCHGELALRTWQPPAQARMLRIHGAEGEGPGALAGESTAIDLEVLRATGDFVGIAGTRRLPSKLPRRSDLSPNADWKDTIVEAMVVERATGRTRVTAPELARLPPGTKPGHFWGGWSGPRFILAFAIEGGRFGHAVLDPASSTVAPARIDARADGVAFAGCDMARCYAIALARDTGTASAVEGAEPFAAHVITFP
ncbi:hypothetical protein [Polyangium mundeleinium]|uniref:DUF3616 domain-containing protein n=1 Tax=Polyangium mundeleinium TaxID=2995306 RepID=A0ABT5ESP6_9BACT|nr:hypothetical protein [Polyangium mundeleinium]MDC0744838.1 hypothetical protein [Polyangium mundeleinium]